MNNHESGIIFTERLLLREMNPECYLQVMGLSDADIKHFFGMQSDEELVKEKERYQLGMTMSGRSFLYFHLVEKDSNLVIGWCGYHTWFPYHRRAEIGYVLNQDAYKGNGFMREAFPVILRFGFEQMNLHRIEALISPGNQPSLKLVERAGFKKEGLLREHYMNDGIAEDSIVFSLLQHEFDKTPF